MNNFSIVAEANGLCCLFMLETMLFRKSVKLFLLSKFILMAWITTITQINKIFRDGDCHHSKEIYRNKTFSEYGIRHSWSENCVLPSERCWHSWSVGVFTYFSFPNSKLSLCSEKPVVCIKYIFFRSPPNLSKVIYAKFTLYLLEIAISEFSLPWISIFFQPRRF